MTNRATIKPLMATTNNIYRQPISRKGQLVAESDQANSTSSVDELKKLLHPVKVKISDLFSNGLDYVEDAIEEFRRNGVDSELNDLSLLPLADHVIAGPDCSRLDRQDYLQNGNYDRRPTLTGEYQRLPKLASWNAAEMHALDRKELDNVQVAIPNWRPIDSARANELLFVDASSRRRPNGQCVFCRNNGESRVNYESHVVKDRHGRVTCPVLRLYRCPICTASGDGAHTIRYCPLNKHRDRLAVANLIGSLEADRPPTTMTTSYLASSEINTTRPHKTRNINYNSVSGSINSMRDYRF